MDTKAAFEKWWEEESGHADICAGSNIGGMIKRIAFDAYQASRAAIEINLPPEHYRVTDKAFYSKELIEAITSHGIRIKGKTE